MWHTMAVDPTQIRSSQLGEDDQYSFAYNETIGAGLTGHWVKAPDGIDGIAVELRVAPGSVGYIEGSLDTLNNINAGTAEGEKWPQNNVSGTTQDWCRPFSAIRGVSVVGEVKLYLGFR